MIHFHFLLSISTCLRRYIKGQASGKKLVIAGCVPQVGRVSRGLAIALHHSSVVIGKAHHWSPEQLADFGVSLPAPSADALPATLYGHSS
jgi:hypothetical protein